MNMNRNSGWPIVEFHGGPLDGEILAVDPDDSVLTTGIVVVDGHDYWLDRGFPLDHIYIVSYEED